MTLNLVSIDSLAIILSYNDDETDICNAERVCKRWRDASRLRTSMIYLTGITQARLVRYTKLRSFKGYIVDLNIRLFKQLPHLRQLDISSPGIQYWPLFFHLITVYKTIYDRNDLHIVHRVKHGTDADDLWSPIDKEKFDSFHLEYINGRLLFNCRLECLSSEFIDAYCTLETERDITMYYVDIDIITDSLSLFNFNRIELNEGWIPDRNMNDFVGWDAKEILIVYQRLSVRGDLRVGNYKTKSGGLITIQCFASQ